MSADTLTADGASVTLVTPQPSNSSSVHYAATGFAVPTDNPDEVVVISGYQNETGVVTGYALDGSVLFSNAIADPPQFRQANVDPSITADGGGGVALSWRLDDGTGGNGDFRSYLFTEVVSDDGHASAPYQAGGNYVGVQTAIFSSPAGYHLEWSQQPGSTFSNPYDPYTLEQQDFGANGQPSGGATGTPGQAIVPWASISLGSGILTISDNQAQLSGQAAITVPGEPAHAMTQVVAAGLADGHSAAVAWADSGTDYVSIYDSASNSFVLPRITLDWSGASDLHVVALNDGGFAVSWEKGGAYYGELFDAVGNGGGKLSLTGDFAGISSHGQLYTVGADSNGNEVVQAYTVNGSSVVSPSVSTSASNYTAPDGVTSITLTGSNQTIHANNGGDTIWSDDTKNVLIGGSGSDHFHVGRAGDTLTGGAGDNIYYYAETPWGGSTITDFHAGDEVNLTGLMATTHDNGTDGFYDGYLKISSDSAGDAQIWANYNLPGNDNWWLVATLLGVPSTTLKTAGNSVLTYSAPRDVSTSDANYTAPAGVTTIYLTGQNQTVHANNGGDTIWGTDNYDIMVGGSGNDTFHIGRGENRVTGGEGADTFAFGAVPWGGSTIMDFSSSQHDVIDLTAMLADQHYTGSDPFADGYLKYDTDASDGYATIWANYNQADNHIWWLVTELHGVATSSLHYSNGLIT